MNKMGKADHLLDLINQPAFSVLHGNIHHVNHAAKGLHIEENMAVRDLISSGIEEYAHFQSGCLYLSVRILETDFGASVTKAGKTDIFLLDDPAGGDQLSALSLAGHQLRIPLSNIVAMLDVYFNGSGSKDPEEALHMAQLKQNVFQIYRVLNNMCDAADWTKKSTALETRNICSIFTEIMEKCSAALSVAKIWIKHSCPNHPIFTQMDTAKVERALYNMISNAAKFSTPEPLIEASLSQSGSKICIQVKSRCTQLQQDMLATAFTRYLRKPTLEDPRMGVGLGMTMVRTAAMTHGGTVLLDQPDPDSIRVTMTMQIRQEQSTDLHCPVSRISNYAGGMDLALVELSELLNPQSYCAKTE